MTSQWSLIGEGEIFIGLRTGGPLRAVGQVKEFKLEVSEETKELKNYQGGGGLADQVSWINKVEATFNFLSLSAKNLAMALRGGDTGLASGTVSNQSHTAYAGGFIPLDGIGPSSVTVTVDPPAWTATTASTVGEIVKPGTGTHFYRCSTAGTTGATEPTWPTDGGTVSDGTVTWTDMGAMVLTSTDFQVKSAGIFIPEGSAKIAATGTLVKVSYSKSAGTVIQALIKGADEYRVFFSGTNFARAGKPLSADMFRVKFSPAKDLSFIGDDFTGLTLTASVLKDDTRQGTDISAFVEIKMVEE
ncbi:MAG: hypothetical protein HQL65_14620 [Magnetococcales bacterium]|nr:hypothetical protein [Magnetococcales bacterium]